MLQDSDSLVAWGAAEELKEISCEITRTFLSFLQNIIRQEADKSFVLDVILSIQSCCQFYDYEIWKETLEIQNLNLEVQDDGQVSATRQSTNVFPNATEVRIFEHVDRYYEHSRAPN